jgi:hypothetical protein
MNSRVLKELLASHRAAASLNLMDYLSLALKTKPSPVQTDQQTPPLALQMENFKSLLPLLTSMAKETTILPLSKENHL